MTSRALFFSNSPLTFNLYRICFKKCYSTEATSKNNEIDITSIDLEPKYAEDLEDSKKEEIQAKRNKSKLSVSDRNRLNGLRPYDRDIEWFHETIRWKKRMLGRHGIDAVNVPVGALWPTKEEIDDKIEYEKTAYPHTLQESWKIIEENNFQKAEEIRLREEEVERNLAKVAQWKKELDAKIAKKEAALQEVKERKERLIEEVRRHFGFKIDPRDERFKQVLEQKEKEDKKRKKEIKKQERAAKFMAHLLQKTTEAKTGEEKTTKSDAVDSTKKSENN